MKSETKNNTVQVWGLNHDRGASDFAKPLVREAGKDAERTVELLKACGYQVRVES